MHRIYIKKLGPIKECQIDINGFNVLTGAQSSGKSTIAKAVYYCRSIKQDIINILMQGGPVKVMTREAVDWNSAMKTRMKDRFLQIFGTSWIMPLDMQLYYYYDDAAAVYVRLLDDPSNSVHNFIDIQFSDKLTEYFEKLDRVDFNMITQDVLKAREREIAELLNDPYETVYIPAGRNLITLLSEQLNYIFTSLESSQLRQIDYITKRYIETILKLKPSFSEGMAGYIMDIEASGDAVRNKHYIDNRPAINLLLSKMKEILGAEYRYKDREERLYIDNRKYVKINFASSGQQEVVWVFNLMFYYLIEGKRVFLILEEPESHLYPDSQRSISEMLGIFLNEGSNAALITTHSPYVLGTFNYMLQAGQCSKKAAETVKKRLRKRCWLDPKTVRAGYIHDGQVEEALDKSDDFTLIRNELIDGASTDINSISDFIIEQDFMVGADD